jgi:phosphatidate cytidylyltransferase
MPAVPNARPIVADVAPGPGGPRSGKAWSDLATRVASAAVMAVLAILAAWWGGWLFALFWTAAAVAILSEWLGMVAGQGRGAAFLAGAAALVAAAAATAVGAVGIGLACLVAAALVVAALVPTGADRVLAGLGVLYAGAAAMPAILLRAGPGPGFAAILFLFAVVWGSDVMAYFTGRSLGGPKLWPRLSPKKTWSGFIGGTLCGGLAGLAVASLAGAPAPAAVLGLGIVLAMVSQGGDLLESAVKRRFGAKDASNLIPGHGGVMDRLDGFIAAATVAAIVAALSDPASLADGLLGFGAARFTIP